LIEEGLLETGALLFSLFNYPSAVKIATPDEMRDLGLRIGQQCRAGDLILLNGPLGAGKTVLVQGIGEALGISEVTSPTFVISRIHKGTPSLIHVDVYRLLEAGKASLYLDDLDLDSPRDEAVTVIEWGGAESARLSEDRLEIEIDRTEDLREVTITAVGDRWAGFSL
jgi:tRNA threonylcarbamoyladenosine biosynthesis protein TsaE